MENKTGSIEAIYPLSPLQQGILYHSVLSAESAVYFEQLSCRISGDFNITAFEKAWKEVVKRYTILRTAFVWKKVERMMQVVYKDVSIPLNIIDWSGLNEGEQKKKKDEFLCEDRKKGFQLNKAPLLRITLILLGENRCQFVWSCHHLLLDGWSRSMLLNEVFNLYESYNKKRPAVQSLSSTPYQAYIKWLEKQDNQRAEKFWRENLKGFKTAIDLPGKISKITDEIPDEDYKRRGIKLGKQLTDRLKAYARENKITINTILQAAWALVLCRFSTENDIVFGTTVSGRTADVPGIETMMGIFINTIPFRVKVNYQTPISEWLKEMQRIAAEYREYEYSSLIDIHQWSDVQSNDQLFNTLFVFENFPISNSNINSRGEAEIDNVEVYSKVNYPLTLVSAPEDELPIVLWYNERIYSSGIIEGILKCLSTFLSAIAEDNGSKTLSSIPALSMEEINKLLYELNKPLISFPEFPCIHEIIQAQVQKSPEAIALIFEERQLTYRELNIISNKLAHYLIEKGVGPEVITGIIADRSIEMIVSILGILKAGGAYLPIDPAYPEERIKYLIKDSGVRIILTQEPFSDKLAGVEELIQIPIDNLLKVTSSQSETDPVVDLESSNLAYVIYTSGSTGKPKGAMLHHRGLCNLNECLIKDFRISSTSKILQFASFSFDASVAEIFNALTTGATLYLAKREIITSPEKLSKFIREKEINQILLPPTLLNNLSPNELSSLYTVVSAGELCPKEVGTKWFKSYRFMNAYGPTEITVISSHYVVKGNETTQSVPIGKPIENVFYYVLDKNMDLVPMGVAGELYIGGIGLGRGYLNRPELTAEKFLPNPFTNKEGERLYKSGDVVRYLPDGNIEFIGRVDNQIKLRGFRIELEEIESVFSQYPGIKNVAAVLKENISGDKTIALFYDTEEKTVIDIDEINRSVKNKLPEYMVPSILVNLEALPLTNNGKIDKKALHEYEYLEDMLEKNSARPSTLTEELLESIWSKLLNIQRIGTDNNFFELGGHSLKATQLVSQIREVLNVELPLREIFNCPTIKLLAQKIDNLKNLNNSIPEIRTRNLNEELKLSYSQERLWFLDQLIPNTSLYNIPVAIRILGNLNLKALEFSIREIIKRHEILRTVFKNENGIPLQIIKDEIEFAIVIDDLTDHISEGMYGEIKQSIEREINYPFNLETGPLFRIKLVKLQDEENILLFVSHHIISDGWSTGIIIKEFTTLYDSYLTKGTVQLPELKIQYADYALWQRDWLRGEVYEKSLLYWKEKLKGELPVLELPLDHPRKAIQTYSGNSEKYSLMKEMTERVLSFSRKEGVTPYMTFLSVFQLMLHKYSGNNDIIVGTPIANRIRKELEDLIGFFVNTLVIRTKINPKGNFIDLLKQVRENTIEAYEHQNMPFEKLVEVLEPERDMSHSPIFQVAFIYQNFAGEKFIINGLEIKPYEFENKIAKYDLSMTLVEEDQKISIILEYNTDIFEGSSIRRMMLYFVYLIERVLSRPNEEIAKYSLLPEDEYKRIVKSWNSTKREYPDNNSVHNLFEEIVKIYPDLTALTFSEIEDDIIKTKYMTYRELNERANQLARYILKHGGGRGKLIGISMARSFDMLACIFAVLKSGGAFVPIDPLYPSERIDFMISDSGICLLLTEKRFIERMPAFNGKLKCIDNLWEEISHEEKTNLRIEIIPEDFAYVIYTSGSTGKPKGTLLHHKGLCNLASAQRKAFKINQDSRILQFASLSFDASVWEIVMALLNGASLSLISNGIMTSIMDYLVKLVNELKVTSITIPPSLLALIPENHQDGMKTFPELKTIIVAGESCPPGLADKWSRTYNMFNAYGPTETTVCATMNLCYGNHKQSTPIGFPIDNFQTYILDKYMNPLPIGASGELYIGGPGLAYGYLNRPEMTAEKFVPDPFSGISGGRLYRTGDLAKYLSDGKMDFIGRTDNQVKIRGFRIEMEEIKAVISEYPGINDVVVSTFYEGKSDKKLAAYLVSEKENPIDILQLRTFMKKQLPDYMIPSVFMFVDSIPLTANGKVDFNALPAPEISMVDKAKFVTARTEDEIILSDICSELLGLKSIGVYDNFFEMGGHSLLAVQFISRIREKFKVNLPLAKLFENPCIADLAEVIKHEMNTIDANLDKIESQENEDLEKMLNEIDLISDEEAKILLSKEMNDSSKES